jgi:hypothetical protein
MNWISNQDTSLVQLGIRERAHPYGGGSGVAVEESRDISRLVR